MRQIVLKIRRQTRTRNDIFVGHIYYSLYARALGSGLDLFDVMGYEFTIDAKDDLIMDLEKDPFISTALSSCLCQVYYKYGKLLAPATACLISAKHFKIKNSCLDNKYDGTGSTTTGDNQEAPRGGIERGDKNTEHRD